MCGFLFLAEAILSAARRADQPKQADLAAMQALSDPIRTVHQFGKMPTTNGLCTTLNVWGFHGLTKLEVSLTFYLLLFIPTGCYRQISM
jgi:hypothetical protein